ncbi:hypothetical protein KIH31_01100 [Paenarthrobacter sp. DKR-5]|uniref:hypothetical protein n=1 Tax=Paenarthrobacter sp. DKR-5 TaxID=2835535 RepID=UPI001BDC7043|nr:hypothetical protein [Paenarthrobacter sp. DKR-5]MBT1001184.1 hypothetical protein [Paenarthrobacter sp. DKR-5]
MSDDLPDWNDAFMRAAFDPQFKFAPIVKPPEHELHAIEATAALLDIRCNCGAGCKPKYHGRAVTFPDCPSCMR